MLIKNTRRRFSAAIRAKTAIEALQERKTMVELSSHYGVHSNMIHRWKKEMLSRSSEIFETSSSSNDFELEREKLFAKIGQLEMEKERLKKFREGPEYKGTLQLNIIRPIDKHYTAM